ncbi:MAG TPA: hypothetical protein PK961_09250 [bacterium]|nr:hypothetical protein [bacterium]
MKYKWLLIMLALALTLSLALACGDDDDDDDDDNDAGDDDDDDDDDDTADDDTGDDDDDDVTLTNPNQTACLAGSDDGTYDPTANPADIVEVTWQNGVLSISDLFAYVNAGFTLGGDVSVAGNTITVTELDTVGGGDSNCVKDLTYQIEGLSEGQYTLVVMRDEGAKAASTIVEITLNLSGGNRAWYVPHVNVFAFKVYGDDELPPGPTDNVVIRYGACDLYNLADQQFYSREWDGNTTVFSYDWYDLDNPGTPDPNCQIPVEIDFGVLGNTAMHFITPSYYEEEWAVKTLDYPVE